MSWSITIDDRSTKISLKTLIYFYYCFATVEIDKTLLVCNDDVPRQPVRRLASDRRTDDTLSGREMAPYRVTVLSRWLNAVFVGRQFSVEYVATVNESQSVLVWQAAGSYGDGSARVGSQSVSTTHPPTCQFIHLFIHSLTHSYVRRRCNTLRRNKDEQTLYLQYYFLARRHSVGI